jgi:hypothetical protein
MLTPGHLPSEHRPESQEHHGVACNSRKQTNAERESGKELVCGLIHAADTKVERVSPLGQKQATK